MKRRFVLTVAILLIAITICAMLVGCKEKPTPDSPPVKFLKEWYESKNKAINVYANQYSNNNEMRLYKTYAREDEKYYSNFYNEEIEIYTKSGNKYLNYSNIQSEDGTTEWEVLQITAEKYEMMLQTINRELRIITPVKQSEEDNYDVQTAIDYYNMTNWKLEINKWVGTSFVEEEMYTFSATIEENKLIILMNDADPDATIAITARIELVLNYKIQIPENTSIK